MASQNLDEMRDSYLSFHPAEFAQINHSCERDFLYDYRLSPARENTTRLRDTKLAPDINPQRTA
ncbi:hypothetical protein PPNK14_06770 [Pectobacterium parmentieri]